MGLRRQWDSNTGTQTDFRNRLCNCSNRDSNLRPLGLVSQTIRQPTHQSRGWRSAVWFVAVSWRTSEALREDLAPLY